MMMRIDLPIFVHTKESENYVLIHPDESYFHLCKVSLVSFYTINHISDYVEEKNIYGEVSSGNSLFVSPLNREKLNELIYEQTNKILISMS